MLILLASLIATQKAQIVAPNHQGSPHHTTAHHAHGDLASPQQSERMHTSGPKVFLRSPAVCPPSILEKKKKKNRWEKDPKKTDQC